jgi:hypothetical protein
VETDQGTYYVVVRECQRYIVYPQTLQVSSDRMLKSYLGLKQKQVDVITESQAHWCCVECKKRVVIYPKRIVTIKALLD